MNFSASEMEQMQNEYFAYDKENLVVIIELFVFM